MKAYTGKTVEEALQAASSETGIDVDVSISFPIRKKVYSLRKSSLKSMT